VVYGLLTTDKHNEYTNEYLSDEFLKALAGKRLNYTESDIEKVKIDSFTNTTSHFLPINQNKLIKSSN
jgi:hypothetical protein